MRYQEEDIETLLLYIEQTIPYVQATIGPGGRIPSDNAEWPMIHRGRATSSEQQLEGILEKVRRLRAESGSNGTPT